MHKLLTVLLRIAISFIGQAKAHFFREYFLEYRSFIKFYFPSKKRKNTE